MPDIYVTKKCLFAQDLAQIGEKSTNWFTKFTAFCISGKGRVALSKRRNFCKSSKGGGGHFQSKKYVVDFGNFKQGFLSMKLIQKCNFRVQGMFCQQLY